MERFDGPNGTKAQRATRRAITAAATGTPYPAVGEEEFQQIMARTRHPILAVVDFPPLPSTVLRPLVDPVPLSPVSLVWRKGLTHPALDALWRAAAVVAAEEGRLRLPGRGWLPERDIVVMAAR